MSAARFFALAGAASAVVARGEIVRRQRVCDRKALLARAHPDDVRSLTGMLEACMINRKEMARAAHFSVAYERRALVGALRAEILGRRNGHGLTEVKDAFFMRVAAEVGPAMPVHGVTLPGRAFTLDPYRLNSSG